MADQLQSFHQIGPSVIEINQSRAPIDTLVVVHLISELDGIQVDGSEYILTASIWTRNIEKALRTTRAMGPVISGPMELLDPPSQSELNHDGFKLGVG